MRGHVWSERELALLRQLWSAGETAEAIGARLGGLSRAAVLGKVFRLRLDAEEGAGKAKTTLDVLAGIGGAADRAPARRRRRPQRRKQPPPAPAPLKQHKSLMELTNTSCRWPHGRPGAGPEKFFFCGAAEADLERGIPYCPRHMQRAYQKAETPPERRPKVWSAISFRGR